MNIKDWSAQNLQELSSVLFGVGKVLLYCKEGESAIYPSDEDIKNPPSYLRLSSQELRFYVFTIQSEQAIKILHEYTFGRRETPYRWSIEAIMPRLKELDDEVNKLYLDKIEKEVTPFLVQPLNIQMGVTIADLKSKYHDSQNERNDAKFYLKVSSYGKYINDNYALDPLFASLLSESQSQLNNFEAVWKPFFDEWKILAKDLLDTADKSGIGDDNSPYQEVAQLKTYVDSPQPLYFMDDYPSHWGAYFRLIGKFDKLGKRDLVAPKHIIGDTTSLKLYDQYENVKTEWDRYINTRELSVWWAHYQITMLAYAVLGDEEERHRYFDKNRLIDAIYASEFNKIKRGETDLTFLKRNNYEEWITRLHNYLIPRMEVMVKG